MTNTENKKHSLEETVWNFFALLFTVTFQGFSPFFIQLRRRPLATVATLAISYLAIRLLVQYALHLRFLEWIWPSLFSGKFLDWLYHFTINRHCNSLYISLFWLYVIALGAISVREKRKTKEMFESIGLTNKFGVAPVLIFRKPIDQYREILAFGTKSISHEAFEAKKLELEGHLKKRIESIKRSSDFERIHVVLTTKELPDGIHFYDLLEKKTLSKDEFYVGEGQKEIVTADIKKLPHLMIAGTTGAGKSVFFKQVLAGLLKSSNHIQVYFIDLKNGLEASDFKGTTNIAIAKDANEALYFLEKISKEMAKRFNYLESKGLKSIEPARDKMDRIVIAVDEASELYADKSKYDPDYEASAEIQTLTNSIARLGRAAGIHLILATQKVNKESINTVIQENISARMCFKMNTLQGSLQVLGNKSALELPTISGRGVWQFGNEECEVQVPYLAGHDVKQICQDVTEDHKNGNKKIFQPMIGANSNNSESNSVKSSLVNLND